MTNQSVAAKKRTKLKHFPLHITLTLFKDSAAYNNFEKMTKSHLELELQKIGLHLDDWMGKIWRG